MGVAVGRVRWVKGAEDLEGFEEGGEGDLEDGGAVIVVVGLVRGFILDGGCVEGRRVVVVMCEEFFAEEGEALQSSGIIDRETDSS